jgi:hypothetical protein
MNLKPEPNYFNRLFLNLSILSLSLLFSGCILIGSFISASIQSPILLTHPFDKTRLISFEYNDGNSWTLFQDQVYCDHQSSFSIKESRWEDDIDSIPYQFVYYINKNKLILFKNNFCRKNDFPAVYEIDLNTENPNQSIVRNIYASQNPHCGIPSPGNDRIRNWKVTDTDQKFTNKVNNNKEKIFQIYSSPVIVYSSTDNIWKLTSGLDDYLKAQTSIVTSKMYQKDKKILTLHGFFDPKLMDLRHDNDKNTTYYLTYSDIWDLDKIQKEPLLKLSINHADESYRSKFQYKSITYENSFGIGIFDPEIQKIYSIKLNYICLL